MNSFLSRHKVDLKAGSDLETNKGAQSIAMWGASPNEASIDNAIEWLDRKIRVLEKKG
jgi:translation initiation factor 2B subunit (eIF-2B alpha/beta/delta family)